MRNKLILILLFLSSLYGQTQTIYTGAEFTFSNSSQYISGKKLNIPDSGTITDINMKFSGSHSYTFAYTYIGLVSPYGTHVALTTENSSYLNTDIVDRGIWDDEASKTMSNVSKPFNDSFRPYDLLSKFDGEEMKGDWELYIYQNSSGTGTITEWELQITHDNSTPSDPPAAQPGTIYRGGELSYIDGVTREKLNITDGGTITDLNIMYQGNFSSIQLLKLISPYGTELELLDNSCHNLIGVDYFVDDEAVTTNIPPCEIRYRNKNAGDPDYQLSKFDGEEMKGEWELYIYATTSHSIADWGLEITFLSGAPKTYISSTENSPSNKSPIPIKVDFDKEVTGFVQSEVTLVNGSISNFTGSGKHYTFDLTPSEDGNVTVDIASGVAKDTANFDNIAAKQFLIVSDQTKPIGGVVNDGTGEDIDVQSNNSTINANWTGFADGLTGIGSYDWSIGISSGGVEVLDWTSSGNNTNASKNNLSLINGQTYYVSVRAIDRAKNISVAANSDGVKVDFTSPSAPSGVVTSSNDGFVFLYWTKNSESDVKNYNIYRSTQQDFVPAPYYLVYSADSTEGQYKDEDVVYGETYYYKITAIDLAGNEGTPSSEVSGRSIDSKPPEVSINSPVSEKIFGTEDQVTISWQASDNWKLGWAKSYYRYSSSKDFVFIDSSDATVGQHIWEVPDSTLSFTNDILVIVSDLESNTARDTMDGVFAIIDNTKPTISISKPTKGFLVKEYDRVNVSWTATDNIEMDSIKVYHTSSQNGNYTLIKSISSDSTETSYDVPFGVSNYATAKLVAIDKSGNTNESISEYFTITDNTPPTVALTNPSENDRFEIGTPISVDWIGSDNVGIASVDINYSTDGGLSWNESGKNIIGSESYQWQAPNFPTNDFIIQVIVHDAVGLTDTSTVGKVEIYPVYPKIVEIEPKPGTLRWLHKEISFTFSRAMDSTSITKNNVLVTSQYSTEPEVLYNSNEKKLIIRNKLGYASLDTIKIKIKGSGIKSSFGYKMDGNNDGTAGGDSSLQYNSLMLADFDTSSSIDVSDLAIMLNALETKDYYYDIGPVVNTIPHYLVMPDSKFDIEDVMSFAMMWNWYNSSNSSSTNDLVSLGNQLNVEFDHSGLTIDFPSNAVAGQVQIVNINNKLEYGVKKNNEFVALDYFNEETQTFTYLMERNKKGVMEIPFKIHGKRTELVMSYKFVDKNGNVVSQSTESVKIENIPEEFALHQNYPNPFNPITTINYDLPQQAHVNLMIYDILGREVVKLVSSEIPAGYQSVIWNTRNNFGEPVSAGIYFYQIQTKDFVKTKKMVLLK